MLLLFSISWGTVSGWWVPACLLLGLLYAWLLYHLPLNLNKKFRNALFTTRALCVSLITLMLVSPLIKSVNYNPQKPLILILQDNSESITMFNRVPSLVSAPLKTSTPVNVKNLKGVNFIDGLSNLKKELGSDYNVQGFHFNSNLENGLTKSFNGKQTDIAKAMHQLNDRFVNQNIGALVLVTDGLYNQGGDPRYEAKNFKNTIYTVALGDTTPKRDLLIANVNYNKTAFLGNYFNIEILVEAYQGKNENIQLSVTEDGRQITSQIVAVNSNAFQKFIPVKLNADKIGLCKYTIHITPIKNEISVQNNTEDIYIEVLNAKQKVLLLYDGPHPDISVIRQSIESNKNYEVKISMLSDISAVKLIDYSLVIFYQLSANMSADLLKVMNSKLPVWYMAGAQTNLTAFNNDQKILQINTARDEMQEVYAQPVTGFAAFTLSDSSRKKIASFPPLMTPYGNYSLSPAGVTLLKQRIGSIETTYPLLAFGDEQGKRTGILTGEGLWRWQLAEFETYGNHNAMEELFSQGVQYLTANTNRQRFIVYPAKNIFDEGENIHLNAELYNDALVLINKPDVKIELKHETGKIYSFMFSRNSQSYQLDAGTLPVGGYKYTASTINGIKQYTTNGQLTVKPLNLEARQSAANHQLLNIIAKQSGGQMLQSSQINRLTNLIRKNETIKTVVYEDKHYSDIIDVKWIFVLILGLLSAEWFFRKREGEI